jgi:hypothetical protein
MRSWEGHIAKASDRRPQGRRVIGAKPLPFVLTRDRPVSPVLPIHSQWKVLVCEDVPLSSRTVALESLTSRCGAIPHRGGGAQNF